MQNDFPIDFVMTWVDDTDPEWRKEYNKYQGITDNGMALVDGASEERFRNWDNLRYWFRGVEKYAPWVNKIFFVTCGQCPDWLDKQHPKLVLVNHKDYIPEKYLPVFSSHPIELNLHRIGELSDNFVYFNDDIFIMNELSKNDFFVDGLPREMAVEFPLYSKGKDSFEHILMNMSGVINSHFQKKAVIKNNLKKWYAPCYGRYLFNNICMHKFGAFSGILTPHFPSSLNKTKMAQLWDELYDDFDNTCSHRFRSPEDINQYTFRFWNIMTGDFFPTNFDKYAKFIAIRQNNVEQICDLIKKTNLKLLCLNDSKNIDDFEEVQTHINTSFSEKFNERSSFELY